MEALLSWLQGSALAGAMRNSLWLYPIVEIVHIVGFVVLVGAVAMFDLRVLGFGRALPVPALAHYLLPWSVGSLLLVVPSGVLMFATQPQDFVGNPAFRLKLVLIAAAGLNALLFHLGPYRHRGEWHGAASAPLRAKAHAAASLGLWIGVIACGRLIAYR